MNVNNYNQNNQDNDKDDEEIMPSSKTMHNYYRSIYETNDKIHDWKTIRNYMQKQYSNNRVTYGGHGIEPIFICGYYMSIYYTKQYFSIRFIEPNMVNNQLSLSTSFNYLKFEIIYQIGENIIQIHIDSVNSERSRVLTLQFNYTSPISIYNWLFRQIKDNNFIAKINEKVYQPL